jgi:glycosyltransferase involved in cell wall biosynthesis
VRPRIIGAAGSVEIMSLCTVIVATYRGQHLGETLSSVLEQTHEELEILVLDDASEERCRLLVEGLGDERLRYLSNETPLGVALNHQKGLDEARGQFISIVNHDDRIAPDVLSTLIAALEAEPSAAAAFAPPHVMDVTGRDRPDRTAFAWRQWGMEGIPTGLIEKWTDVSPLIGFQSIASVVYRRAAVDRIPRQVGGSYDTWMAYRAIRRSPVIHVPEAVGHWREHPDNLTLRRSWRRTYEVAYLNGRVALDTAMPVKFRARSMLKCLRALAATVLDRFVRGQRVMSRP